MIGTFLVSLDLVEMNSFAPGSQPRSTWTQPPSRSTADRSSAVDAHSAACADYERLRDETPALLEDAIETVDALVGARMAIGEARGQLERLGAKAECVTPRFLQQTDAGARSLEAIRSKLLARI